MAVVIASNLRKELAGSVLFDGVSFSVERRDRVALSGPNGAGKTTLLRILAGETEKHGGELAFAKGTRVALHDQRPPLEQELTLREYVLAGARDLGALEPPLVPRAGEVEPAPTLELEHRRRHRLEEPAIVCDEDHRSVERGELTLEPLEVRHVEVVGGLVEEEQVGVAAERAGERGARQLAAGERPQRAVEVLLREAEPAHD